MKQKDIEKGRIKQRKYLLPLNKVVSDKRILAVLGVLIFAILFLGINYLFNTFLKFSDIIKNISDFGEYLSLKNMFMFDFKKYYVFYILSAVISLFVVTRFVFLVNVNIKDMNVGQKNDSRWTTIEEIKQQYPSMKEQGEPLKGKGGWPVCQYQGKIYYDDTAVNNLILGMTRSGKGEQFILLMIWIYCNATEKSSLVINDPKTELFTTTAGTLEKSGYDVYVFNLIEPSKGIGYDPLELIKQAWKLQNYTDGESLARSLAEIIYHPSRIEGEGKYWASTAAALFSALVIAQVNDCIEADKKLNAKNLLAWRKKQKAFEQLTTEKAQAAYLEFENSGDKLTLKYIPTEMEYTPTKENEKKANIYSVCKFFMDLTKIKIDDTGRTALDVFFEERPEDDRAKMKFFSAEIAPNRTKSSIYSSMYDALTIFTYEDMAKMTAESTIDISELGFGKKPMALFLLTPDWDTSAHFLVSILITQIYFVLSKRASKTSKKKCDRDVVHILEEAGEVPEILNIQNMVSIGSGKGIFYNFVIQAYSQLDKYKEIAKTIKQNCGNHIYILSEDKETRQEFSEAVGKETVTNVHRTGKYLALEKTMMEVYEERPLITTNELATLAEGENVIVRYIYRRDNNRNKIRAYPIFNTGAMSFKYRYEYLIKQFPSDVPFDSLPLHCQCDSDVQLKDIRLNAQNIFAEKLQQQQAQQEGRAYLSQNETPETVKLIKDLDRADLLIQQMQTFVKGKNCSELTVTEAITELEKAESLSLISKAEKESIVDLIL